MTYKNKIVLDLDGVLSEIDTEKDYIDRDVNDKVVNATKNAIEEGDTTIAEVFKIGKVETPLRKSKFKIL